MSRRLFAVGDIHGYYAELMALMYQLINEYGLDPRTDQVIFLGDYVDGGPDTKRVLQSLMAWQQQYPHWMFLRGNHEDLMLDALVWNNRKYGSWDLWWGQGGKATAMSYLPEDASAYERAIMQPEEWISKHHLEWLQTLPLRHETEHYHFVHAGFRPTIPIEEQSEEDMLWIRESFWAQRYNFGKPVIFGHTPFDEPNVIYDYRKGHRDEIVAIGIDTMFHDFGKLTAVELDPANPQAAPTFTFSTSVI